MKILKEFLIKTENAKQSVIGVLADSTKAYCFKNILASFIISFFAITSLFMVLSKDKYFTAEYITTKSILFFVVDVIVFMAVLLILSTFAFNPKKGFICFTCVVSNIVLLIIAKRRRN